MTFTDPFTHSEGTSGPRCTLTQPAPSWKSIEPTTLLNGTVTFRQCRPGAPSSYAALTFLELAVSSVPFLSTCA
jgi:hypothetical protein